MLPSKRIGLVARMASRTTSMAAFCTEVFLETRFWMASRISSRVSDTAAFRMAMGQEMTALEGTARNSNLLPVKAKGEVRFRSV